LKPLFATAVLAAAFAHLRVPANVVMRRRRAAEPFGHLGIAPIDDGVMLSYTVPLR